MINIYRFRIKRYKGVALTLRLLGLKLKVERITLNRKWNFKIELTNWNE